MIRPDDQLSLTAKELDEDITRCMLLTLVQLRTPATMEQAIYSVAQR